jgi:uncharacterized repeat protein (TIGR01451 family)
MTMSRTPVLWIVWVVLFALVTVPFLSQLDQLSITGFATLDAGEAIDVALAPLSVDKFVVAWVDKDESDISFKIMHPNGTVYVPTIDIDDSDTASRVAVAPINESDFIISWLSRNSAFASSNGGNGHMQLKHAIYDSDGSVILAPTMIDYDVGNNVDVDVTQLGDKYVICNANDDDDDADYRIFDNVGTQIMSELSIDEDMQPQATHQNLVGCAALNESMWVYAWFDDDQDDVSFHRVSSSGSTIGSTVDIDTSAGSNAHVATAALTDRFAVIWYDDSAHKVKMTIRDASGVSIVGTVVVDASPGADSRVAITTAETKNGSNVFVAVWWEKNTFDIKVAVYGMNGLQVTAPTVIEPMQDQAFRLVDVAGGNAMCPGTFIAAYTNDSNMAEVNAYHLNGSLWSGNCQNDQTPPSVVPILPVAGDFRNISQDTQIRANVTDDVALAIVTATITYPNGTQVTVPLTVDSGDEYNGTFAVPNLVGRYNVSFYAQDTSGNSNASEQTHFFGDTNIIAVIGASSRDGDGNKVNLTLHMMLNQERMFDETDLEFSFAIPSGLYTMDMVPVDQSRIQNITIYDANITSSFDLIGIDHAKNPYANNFVPFGLDPAGLDFAYATVTRKSTGTDLYKCKNWNYSAGTCGGTGCSDDQEEYGTCEVLAEWELLKTGLTQGEFYQFNLTTTDPGYSEYTESSSENSTTSTAWVNKTSTTFTPSVAGEHLIIATMQIHGNSQTSSVRARVLADGVNVSEVIWEPKDSNIISDYQAYGMHLMQNLSASPHTVTLQWASESGATTFAKNARISVVSVDEGEYVAQISPTALGTGFASIATTSFTPAVADDYLIIASGEVKTGTCTLSTVVDLQLDGASVDNSSYECKDATDYKPFMFHTVENLTVSSHNLTVRARRNFVAGGEIRNVRISAIRLTPDYDAQFASSDTSSNVSCAGSCTSNFVNKTVLTFTPVESGEYLFLATAQFNSGTNNDQTLIKLNVDGTSECEVIQEQRNNIIDDQLLFVCQKSLYLNNNSHTATISFAAQGNNPFSTVKNARITAIRLSPLNLTLGQPLLVVSKNDLVDPVQNGSFLNYVVTLNNVGTGIAQNVTLTETYPANVTFVSATPSPDVGNTTWLLGNVSNGTSVAVNITVLVDAGLVGGDVLSNLVNVTYENSTTTLFASASEDTTVAGGPPVLIAQGIGCVLTLTPQVAEPGENILYQGDLLYSNGVPVKSANISSINLTLHSVVGTNATVLSTFPMSFLSDGIWFAELDMDLSDGNYLTRLDAIATDGQAISCSEVFTVFGRGVFSMEAISPDLTHVNETVGLAAQILNNGAPVPIAQLGNASLSIDQVNGSYSESFNVSNGLMVSNGLLSLDGVFNETGIYLLNWSVEYFGRQKETKELVVVVDWDSKLDNLSAGAGVIALIIENRDLLLEVLKEIEHSQEFSEEEIFLITDSVNSMSSLVQFIEDGTLSPEEAERQLGVLQAQLAQTLGERITGQVIGSGFSWQQVLSTGATLLVCITLLLGIIYGIRKRTESGKLNQWVQKEREYGWSDTRIRTTLRKHGYSEREIGRAMRRK